MDLIDLVIICIGWLLLLLFIYLNRFKSKEKKDFIEYNGRNPLIPKRTTSPPPPKRKNKRNNIDFTDEGELRF